ncbi:MAG: DUF2520 domain-containing protein [Clostridiales Family XIII bacterium]|jgi:predicted short-subunit dehydrogenase-like oxidoreductase (DUF2520 family)|nr:DUF2520 domain-containing protein [Clostridiales Family XIII bacterium]
MINVGFIGAGKVGLSLGAMIATYSDKHDAKVVGYASGRLHNAVGDGTETTYTGSHNGQTLSEQQADIGRISLDTLVKKSDLIFITVPDDNISEVSNQIRTHSASREIDLSRKAFIHTSGAHTSDDICALKELGATVGSLHPLLAVKDNSSEDLLKNAYYTFEGDIGAYDRVVDAMGYLRHHTEILAKDKKVLYHAASVYFSNFVVGLASIGEEILATCGLPEAFAKEAWKHLFIANAHNVVDVGPTAALTGPALRGDAGTISGHLEQLGRLRQEVISEKFDNNDSNGFRNPDSRGSYGNGHDGGSESNNSENCENHNNVGNCLNDNSSANCSNGGSDDSDSNCDICKHDFSVDNVRIYEEITKQLLKIAETRNPEKDYSRVAQVLTS